jgi:hypothetical protein
MEVGYMQRFAAGARFDQDAQIKQNIMARMGPAEMPAPVPLKKVVQTTAYVNDPNADWGGNVPRRNVRKTYGNAPVAASSVTFTEHGVAPAEHVNVCEHNPNVGARRHYEDDMNFKGVDQQTPISNVYQTGPGSTHSAAEWRTSYQDGIENREATNADNWVEGKGSNRGGKKRVTPAYEFNAKVRGYGPQAAAVAHQQHQRGGNSSNFSAARGGGGRSILAGLGSSVLAEMRQPSR